MRPAAGLPLLAALLAAALLVGPAAAQAPTPLQAAREAGMMGYWAQDCARPPSPENWWKRIEAEGATGVRSVDDPGNGDTNVTRFTQARRIDGRDTAVRLLYEYDNGLLDVIYRVENDVFFTWWSKEVATGEVYVVDGVLLADKEPIMRLNRCPGPPPVNPLAT